MFTTTSAAPGARKLDLSAVDPHNATPAQVAALKARVLELEALLERHSKLLLAQHAPPGASASASAAPAAADAKDEAKRDTAAPATAQQPDDEDDGEPYDPTDTASILRKLFRALRREARSENIKFQQAYGSKLVKYDFQLQAGMFDALFRGKGTLIQPTPENKPKSKVVIMRFDAEQVKEIFGDELKLELLKGCRWTKGGIPVKQFGLPGNAGGSSISRAKMLGTINLHIKVLEVNYSTNSHKLTMKFEVEPIGSFTAATGEEDDYYG